jgi:CRP-like cAMP-binding protein
MPELAPSDIISLERYLRGVPVFAKLPSDTVRDVAKALELRTFGPGQILIRKGQVSSSFFLLKTGSVGFIVEEDGGDVKHTYDAAGDHFGEIALMNEISQCTATAKTATGCECYVLDKLTFD